MLTVHVTSGPDKVPIPGAILHVVPGRELGETAPDPASAIATGTTDALGSCSLDLGPDPLDVLLFAEAPRRLPAAREVSAGTWSASLELASGGKISGQVVDDTGLGIAKCTVLVRDCALAGEPPNRDAISRPGAIRVSVVTDAHGRFEASVDETGWYLVDAWSPGLVVDERASGARGGSVDGAQVARAGDELRLRLGGVRGIDLLVRDGADGQSVDGPFVLSLVIGGDAPRKPEDGVPMMDMRPTSGTSWSPGGDSRLAPGRVRRRVRLPAGLAPPDHLRVQVEAHGYQGLIVDAALQRIDSAGDTVPQPVTLMPNDAGERTSVTVSFAPRHGTLPAVAGAPILVLRGGAAAPVTRMGLPTVVDGVWRFRRLPVGRYAMNVQDDIGPGPTVDLDLVAGQESSLTYAMPAPRGVVVRVRGPGGRELSGFQVLATRRSSASMEPGPGAGSRRPGRAPFGDVVHAPLFRVAPPAGAPYVVALLAPGRYELSVTSPGMKGSPVEVEVPETGTADATLAVEYR